MNRNETILDVKDLVVEFNARGGGVKCMQSRV